MGRKGAIATAAGVVSVVIVATVLAAAVATRGVRPDSGPGWPDQVAAAGAGGDTRHAPATPELPPSAAPSTPPAATPGVPPRRTPAATGPCARTGPGQAAVERYLARHPQYGRVTVDGRQDAADCAAIRAFQLRFSVLPSVGYAGPVTGRVATRLTAADARRGLCGAGSGLTVCVDLTSQTLWVVRGGQVVLGPTTIRTGRAGLATPAGTFSVREKKRLTRSSYFDVDLPYWQRFHGDMGFHSTPSYLYEGDSPGSHGCINLLNRDARSLYARTAPGTPVRIFGRKPGT